MWCCCVRPNIWITYIYISGVCIYMNEWTSKHPHSHRSPPHPPLSVRLPCHVSTHTPTPTPVARRASTGGLIPRTTLTTTALAWFPSPMSTSTTSSSTWVPRSGWWWRPSLTGPIFFVEKPVYVYVKQKKTGVLFFYVSLDKKRNTLTAMSNIVFWSKSVYVWNKKDRSFFLV